MGRTYTTPQDTLFAQGSVPEVSIDWMFHNFFGARLLGVNGVIEVYDVFTGLVLSSHVTLS